MSEQVKRPQQVTLAAIVAGSASLVMLLSIADKLSRWNSVDLRETFTETLGEEDLGQRLGVTVDQAMELARVGLFVVGALAAACLVLVVFAARRDKGARVGLSVLSVSVLLLSLVGLGLVVDPLLAGFVAAGTVMLWREPARDWYDGRAPRAERPAPRSRPTSPEQLTAPDSPTAASPPPTGSPTDDPPPADSGPPGQPVPGPAPYSGAYGSTATATRPVGPAEPPAYEPLRRPTQVVAACVVTWVGCGVVALGALLSLLGTVVPGARGQVRDQVEQVLQDASSQRGLDTTGITIDELLVTAQVMLAIILVWALVAAALAVMAFLGQGWARITLLVSAVFSGLLGLLGVLGALPLLLLTLASVFVVSRLVSPPVVRWYAAREQQRR